MKGIIILVDGFEDVEALVTIDILRRSKIDVDMVSLDKNELNTQSNNKIVVSYLLSEVNLNDYDFLVIPGGKAVFNILDKDKRIDEVIDYFYNNKKLIATICAAPRLVAKRGYFEGHNYTSFPGCVDNDAKGNKVNDGVVISGNFICAKAMYYSTSFALAIVEKLLGEDAKSKVLKQIKGE